MHCVGTILAYPPRHSIQPCDDLMHPQERMLRTSVTLIKTANKQDWRPTSQQVHLLVFFLTRQGYTSSTHCTQSRWLDLNQRPQVSKTWRIPDFPTSRYFIRRGAILAYSSFNFQN